MRALAICLVLAGSSVARADLINHDRLRAHVEAELARVDVAALTPAQRDGLYANRLALMAGALVPIYGTWTIEHKVFGGLRPAGVIFDWILGGLAPVALGISALATSGRTRSICAWTALGLYGSTRLGIMIIGNLHISEYNRVVRRHLEAPGVALTASW